LEQICTNFTNFTDVFVSRPNCSTEAADLMDLLANKNPIHIQPVYPISSIPQNQVPGGGNSKIFLLFTPKMGGK